MFVLISELLRIILSCLSKFSANIHLTIYLESNGKNCARTASIFLANNHIFQSGLKSLDSTEAVLNYILMTTDSGASVTLVMLDSAFDTVDHEILISRLVSDSLLVKIGIGQFACKNRYRTVCV